MALIGQTARRHPRVRLLREGIFALLVLGALTTLLPFLLLIAGSLRSGVDQREPGWIPRYLHDPVALWRKHVEALFDERLDPARAAYDEDFTTFESLTPPAALRTAEVDAWNEFLRDPRAMSIPFALGHLYAPVTRAQPHHQRGFKDALADRFDAIEALNEAMEVDFASWTAFVMPSDDLLPRRTRPGQAPLDEAFHAYKQAQSELWRFRYLPEGYFRRVFLKARYGRSIDGYNQAHGTAFARYDDVPLSARSPDAPASVRADWEEFVRHALNLIWIRIDASATPAWHAFLRARYGSVDVLNTRYGAAHAQFSAAPLPAEAPIAGHALADWELFVNGWIDPADGRWHGAPATSLSIHDIARAYRDWLCARFGSLERANTELGIAVSDWEQIRPPQKEAHYQAVMEQVRALRHEFLVRNYATVLDYLLHHGRGLWNTAIYCGFAVLCALIVNPLAAYALSRYRPASAYKVLLFLLLTMAFPPMVTQIPAFLLLRDLHLLNTFWALILPGLANGYSIFLLKGFFDSLPRELFEQAQIDGAGEWTLFWRITMSLSKPILAVVALHAFTAAYANFMFALLICQDPQMWTLMVWLYQLQQRSGPGVIYASLVIAALPTLLIFLFCQKIILRGIVIPVEK